MIARFVYSALGGVIKNRRTLAAIYKSICIIISGVLCGLLAWNSLRDGKGMIGPAMVAAMVFIALLYIILTKKTSTLHAFPASLRNFETHGGKREIVDATGEHVLRIVFDNGCEVELNFNDGVYTASLKNDEWDSVDTEETEDEAALTEIMERMTAKAAEYVPAEPFEMSKDDAEDSDKSNGNDESDDDSDDDDDSDNGNDGGYIYTYPGDDGAVL